MKQCSGCGNQVPDNLNAFRSKDDYCSTCRIEASNKGQELGDSSNVVLVVGAIAIVFAILKWLFEFIWDYKWWIIGIVLAAYLFLKSKK